jgi:hypothetical protein
LITFTVDIRDRFGWFLQQEQQLTNARHAVLGEGIQSTALRDKLAELEKEIDRFRKENASLESLRREREEVRKSCIDM